VPFRWREIFEKENELAKAKADATVESHADPKAQLALAIRQLQDQHDQLEHACAVVIAEAKTQGDKLQHDMAQEANLVAQAKAAQAVGHTDAARAIASQIVVVRQLIASEQPAYDQAKAAADQAQQAFADNSAELQQKMAEAKQLDAQIDQAAMQHNINEAMKAVTSMTSHVVPSFDQVRDKVQGSLAQEQADAQLSAGGYDAVNDQHLVQQAAADEVLASLGGTPVPAASPTAAVPAAPAASRPASPQPDGGSPMDKL
jgi:phage shock protein A